MPALASRILLLLAGLIFALAAMEVVLRTLGVGDYDVGDMEPGLLEYDRTLGWRLVPGAEISHRHPDFAVTYRVDDWGLRRDERVESPRDADEWVLGDSFTFGIGVEDDETFVAQVNRREEAGGRVHANLGQIGYATDQEALLLDKLIEWHGTPDRVSLVVYVGNDLVDNLHPVPTQAPRGKPFFAVAANELSLQNVPVPTSPQASPSFAREVLGRVYQPGRLEGFMETTKVGSLIWSLRNRVLGHRQLEWDGAFDDQIEVFLLIVERMAESVPQLDVVILGGKASVEDPESFGGQYQHYLKQQILDLDAPANVHVHDLIEILQFNYEDTGAVLYHPREGHLTPTGHRVIAENWPTLDP